MKGAGAHFDIIRLKNDAALGGPIGLKLEDELLKAVPARCPRGHHPLVRKGFWCDAT
jgi:hypothetical protein